MGKRERRGSPALPPNVKVKVKVCEDEDESSWRYGQTAF